MQQREKHQAQDNSVSSVVVMQLQCMAIHGQMYGYAVMQSVMQAKTALSNLDLGKPLLYKGFRVFPNRGQTTPTKAVVIYSERCMTMHWAMHKNSRNEWITP